MKTAGQTEYKKKRKSINETRSALILKLLQMEIIRLLDMGAGVLDEMELKAYHHLCVTLPRREGKGGKFLAMKCHNKKNLKRNNPTVSFR